MWVATRPDQTRLGVRCGCRAGPLGVHLCPVYRGRGVPKRVTYPLSHSPWSCLSPESRPGKEAAGWRAGGMGFVVLIGKEKRDRGGQQVVWSQAWEATTTKNPETCTPWAFEFLGIWDFLCPSYSSIVVCKIFENFSFLLQVRGIIRLSLPPCCLDETVHHLETVQLFDLLTTRCSDQLSESCFTLQLLRSTFFFWLSGDHRLLAFLPCWLLLPSLLGWVFFLIHLQCWGGPGSAFLPLLCLL